MEHKGIPDRVRAHLLALGIPATKHTPERLVEFFPIELNIGAAGLDGADLANVLVHLAGSGAIDVTAAATVKKVEPGWHFCQFYRDFKQLLDLVAPYIAEGLQNEEGCCWVLPEAVTSRAACTALSAMLSNVDSYLASGQLELLSHPRWYLDPGGRLKSFDEISTALLQKQDAAIAKGFKFLRAAGDTGWVSKTEQSKSFIDYELKINSAIKTTKVAAVCTYRADVTADELVAIVSAHQDALYEVPAE